MLLDGREACLHRWINRPIWREGVERSMFDTIPDDMIIDFIDGLLRKKTPEEYVRQNVERSLVQEYKYPKGAIAVEYPIKVGSARKRVDLVIFQEGKKSEQASAYILVECKKEGVSPKDKKEGVDQLAAYMASCPNVKFGLWSNGSDQRICLQREDIGGEVVFSPVVDIPLFGQELSENAGPDRHSLFPATGDNLLFAFKRCHNYIAGSQGLQKPEAFWELLKVIFCKIEDERSFEDLKFYITNREQRSPDGQLKCKMRLEKLFDAVREKYSQIFKPNETLELNRSVLSYVVSQLQNMSLLDSSVDVKGVAYEEIVGSNLRGDRGEFFTPRNACKMAVAMLDPEPGARIADPACGTGGFLISAMNCVLGKLDARKRGLWRDPDQPTHGELQELFKARQDLLSTTLAGLDINPNLVRAAKMNMVMNNDGAGGLAQADSLRDPSEWSEEAREVAALGSFDFVFTNPPFGTKIRIDQPEVLEQYELAKQWELEDGVWRIRLDHRGRASMQGAQPPEILFIERCVQLLKPGTGKMAMVIPNGILNNPPLGYVRHWLLQNTQLLAVVDLQRDLFQPRNDTQTSMVLLRRLSAKEKKARRDDYPIFFCVTDRIGHDKRGRQIYVRDEEGMDVLEDREIKVRRIVDGSPMVETIRERGPVVDDQLPLVPAVFHDWARENGVSV